MNSDYTSIGNLQVDVLQGVQTAPIDNATVRISDSLTGEVIDEILTDISGQTTPIELPAPPVDLSQSKENEIRPYAVYNLTVRAGGFETLHISGVQVLADSLAIQPVRLKYATENGFNVQNILITPHTLWGDFPPKIPESDVKPLPKPSGFVVLPEPVIPEFIVVHLGRPEDSSAQNVWVYFKDYIKNVASSEIYSTWNVEAIKANVLAILSFTLNRVYTEWYRSKGFDFTITNSTAYDQAFVAGRNVFLEISNVVDDLFNTFITKPNIAQPLFTQYCDGVRVQCDGLSQWGSQRLSNEGYDAISIIRNYYGYDAYLATAEQVEGVPVSFPGEVLRIGSSGSNVETIQRQLNRIADNFPAINKVNTNGIYGPETETAVLSFQRIFNLPHTGEVDFATWYRISNIYTSVAGLA